jgi:uncharacterized protein (TIGR03435 family)
MDRSILDRKVDLELTIQNATRAQRTTTTQFRLMLQNLLAERFKLKVHRDSRDMSMFRLLVAVQS